MAAYLLLIGISILLRALRAPPPCDTPPAFAVPLGIIGGFLDAIGGGGWGAIVTSTLLGSGHSPRVVIGSVNIAEFVVTVAAATTFFIEIGLVPLNALLSSPEAFSRRRLGLTSRNVSLLGHSAPRLGCWCWAWQRHRSQHLCRRRLV